MLYDLVSKEVKNLLRDKKIIITTIVMPLVIFAVLGAVYSFGIGQAVREAAKRVSKAKLLVCDLDGGNFSRLVAEFSRSFAREVDVVNTCSASEIVKLLDEGRYTLAIIVPKGFSERLALSEKAYVKVMTSVKGLSFSSMAATSVLEGVAKGLSDFIRAYIIASKGLNPEYVTKPVVSNETVVFRGSEMRPDLLGMLSGAQFMFMFAPIAVISTALGIAATTMAVENEEKTLEVLLTLPIPRSRIVMAKLMGSTVLVLIATVSFMAGFLIYIYSIFTVVSTPLTTVGASSSSRSSPFGVGGVAALFNVFTPHLLVVIGASTFLSLIAVAALGILLGSMAPDVRASQTYIGQLTVVIMIPAFLLAFTDLATYGFGGQVALILVSPFIAPMLVLKAYLEGYLWVSVAAVMWSLAFSAVMVLAASKLLGSEKLLSIQHRFRRRGVGRPKLKLPIRFKRS